jgi:acyl carrier protein
VAYAAANAFMDAFVRSHNRQNSTHWVTINWDGWRLREEAQSESTARGQNPTFGSGLAEFLITPPEGMAAFHAIRMGLLGEQIVVSTGDLQARLEKWITFTATRKADAEWAITGLSAHARPQLHNTYLAPRNQIEQKIAEVWQALLGIEKVGIHDNFFELGGDSLLIVQLRRKLQEALHHEFLTTDLFEHPTISTLVESLRQTEVESATPRQAQDRIRNQRAALEEAAELKGRRQGSRF